MRHLILSIAGTVLCLGLVKAQDFKTDSTNIAGCLRDSLPLTEIRVDTTVKYLEYEYVKIDTIYDSKAIRRMARKTYPDCKRFVFAIEGGAAVRIAQDPANLPDDLAKYRKDLKFGYNAGASASVFMTPNMALGVYYSIFSLNNATNYMSYEEPSFEGSRSDDINVHFVGPMFTIRTMPRPNHLHASYEFVLGYSFFNNRLKLNQSKYDLEGGSFCFSSTVGTDFLLSKNYAAGIALRLVAASAKKLKTSDGQPAPEVNHIDNLSRISLVLRLKFFN
ncbi:MAG: hypothetical protein LBG92_05810 [Prevotellaceae bacterium]|jgi:hypothetical protein|nr:hypothetical protein [Prevotellaceae bacterium]